MKIFVPVAWPYANGELHLGTLAGSLLAPDIFARFHRQKGNDVLMVSGTDMHGTPVELAAEKSKKKPEARRFLREKTCGVCYLPRGQRRSLRGRAFFAAVTSVNAVL